jgi:hypothetical protein
MARASAAGAPGPVKTFSISEKDLRLKELAIYQIGRYQGGTTSAACGRKR